MVRDCMRFFLGLVFAGAVSTIGCGDDGQSPTDGRPASDVKGSILDIHVTEAGDVSSTRGAMNFEIAAVFPGIDGTPQEKFAAISKDGTFVIPKVPEVPYDLRFVEFLDDSALPPRYVMNAPREIDLGRVYVGRPDAAPITTSTEIGITATDIVPWTVGDSLEFFSLNSGAAGELVPTTGTYPTAGAMALDKYRVDTSKLLNATLVDSSKGDKAVITQLARDPDVTTAYRSVRKILELPSFTQVDGMPTLVSGAFTDVAQKEVDININTPTFTMHSTAVHPQATAVGKIVRLLAEPGGERATTSTTPSLFVCETIAGAILPDKFSYGNPFPAAWSEVVSTEVGFLITHVAPSGVPKDTIIAIGQSGPVDSFTSPAVALLSPPIDIKVNDAPAYDTLMGIGYSPTVSWSPPLIGTPAAYIIAIRRLDPGGATTRTTAIFSTVETKIRIPEGLLDYGYNYYFRVSVRSKFDIGQPFKSGTSNAYASAVTGVLTP